MNRHVLRASHANQFLGKVGLKLFSLAAFEKILDAIINALVAADGVGLHFNHRLLDRRARAILGHQLGHVLGQGFPFDCAVHADRKSALAGKRDRRVLLGSKIIVKRGLENPHFRLDDLELLGIDVVQARLQHFS